MRLRVIIAGMALIATGASAAPMRFDASKVPPPPETGYLKLGTAVAPSGDRIGVNSRYLTFDGKPWLPVMGEAHFVRIPEARWDEELAKIKASGVDIVATYMFWNYHEETPGHFDFTGNRDIRRFIELAQRHGLKVLLRLGPWAHGEVRHGGIPDWVVRQARTRSTDPIFLHYVERYWREIAGQVKGLLWKDGGPIIGIQLANEYNVAGPGQGRAYIDALKRMALRLGFDVPLYTVTGWDGAVYPRREVTPVFGGYPDQPWGQTDTRLPPQEVYAFRFDSRVSGGALGAQTSAQGAGDADADIPHTPFLGAEFGGGVPTMYRRRPVIAPDDIAAMLPVELGSGVNLYGYYMYHGGRNLIEGATLQESTAIGGYNDLPIIDYDFQAPFGEYGQANPVLGYIRPFHLFLESFGALLAPMTVRRPDLLPKGAGDLKTLRASVRSDGHSAFVFVNNHVRQYRMPPQPDTQFTVRLANRTVRFPEAPVTIPPDSYFIWPVALDLGGVRLDWATAQPVTRMETSEGQLLVLEAQDGIPVSLQVSGARSIDTSAAQHVAAGGARVIDHLRPGTGCTIRLTATDGRIVTLLILTSVETRRLSRIELGGRSRLLLTDRDVAAGKGVLSLLSRGEPAFRFALYPAPEKGLATAGAKVRKEGREGLFTRYLATVPARDIPVRWTPLRAPSKAPPIRVGGPAGGAVEPYPEVFGQSAGWSIELPKHALDGLDDAFLKIDWTGDVARLFAGPKLLDDRFYDGRVWEAGLSEHRDALANPLTLTILPLRGDAPVYIDNALRPKLAADAQVATLRSVSVIPQYRLDLRIAR
ncbi:MAG TPA: beta-galactosidase [Sphingomonas sp.]|nr:beta-galactosidase [Sphingomonas sp.]